MMHCGMNSYLTKKTQILKAENSNFEIYGSALMLNLPQVKPSNYCMDMRERYTDTSVIKDNMNLCYMNKLAQIEPKA